MSFAGKHKIMGGFVVTITDSKCNAFGGHLFEGYVPATLEIIILSLYKKILRKSDTKPADYDFWIFNPDYSYSF